MVIFLNVKKKLKPKSKSKSTKTLILKTEKLIFILYGTQHNFLYKIAKSFHQNHTLGFISPLAFNNQQYSES